MNKLIAGAAAGAAFMASSAFGGPTYAGDTYADFGTNPPLPKATGYYIWSNENQTDWSVRWTGNNNGDVVDNGGWSGTIDFGGSGVIDAVTEFTSASGDAKNTVSAGLSPLAINDKISFDGTSGDAWAGFDFSLKPASGTTVIDFTLISDLLDINSGTQESVGIFIGKDYSPTSVTVQSAADSSKVSQNFSIAVSVPEPGTLALLGFGILGLSLTRRKAS